MGKIKSNYKANCLLCTGFNHTIFTTAVVFAPQKRKTWEGKKREADLDSKKKNAKNWEKEGENQEKAGKGGKKRTNWEGSFTLPLLTERAGYATETWVSKNVEFKSVTQCFYKQVDLTSHIAGLNYFPPFSPFSLL